jgi:transposase InsO family protein
LLVVTVVAREGPGLMLVELSVVEQRYHAVMEVVGSLVSVTEVAERYGVSRKTVHAWLRRYEAEGLAGLADRSHRPHHQPRQVSARVEAAICELRRAHRRWGPRRLVWELARRGVDPVPSRSTVYRVLVRHQLVEARARKRRRQDYKRWQRPAPMQLWQLDITGSLFLADGTECKVVTGIDDHSRYCVIATVVRRATGRAVCAAFAAALRVYGCPDQVLTDNGKQFTGKFTRPQPVEVLFDRICRKNGIEHLLTKVRSPTTTGKIERWHQTLQVEFLAECDPLPDLRAAQAALDRIREEYNTARPHQELDMATPASRFRPVSAEQPDSLPLWLPPDLRPLDTAITVHAVDDAVAVEHDAMSVQDAVANAVTEAGSADPVCEAPWRGQGRSSVGRSTLTPPADPHGEPAAAPSVDASDASDGVKAADAVEVDRVMPPSGNLAVRGQQFWLGPQRAGQNVTLWIDTTTVHLSVDGRHLKTLPSRLSTVDLARLRADGARPAGPPPARPSPGLLAAGAPVEVDRTVHAQGVVVIAGRQLPVGLPLAGRRVTLRLEQHVAHVIVDDVLWRTVAFTLGTKDRAQLRGAHLPGPTPKRADHPARVQRRVSSRGGVQVVGQRVQVGFPYRGNTVTIEVDDTVLRVLDHHDQVLKVVPRTNTKEVTRYKAYGRNQRAQA